MHENTRGDPGTNPTDPLVPALAFHPTPARKLADSNLPPAIQAAGHASDETM